MISLNSLPPISRADLTRAVEAEFARRSLLDFTRWTYSRYNAEPAHELIASALDQVVEGEIRRLMIFAPPQHGKSELTSVRLPAFWLGKHPEDPVILTSYAASLAESKSRQARSIVESDEFQELFPAITTRSDSRAVNRWELQGHRGGMLAVGVGGPVTGHGGRLGLIDDPFENWAQAQSETIRGNVREWYRTTFRPRIWQDGAIVLVMTRWHEDDLAGWLLQTQGDEWTVLRLPALAETQEDRDRNNAYLGLPTGEPDPLDREPGEALCPELYSEETLAELQNDVGSQGWAAEYQGVPRALEGNRFKRPWFKIADAAPTRAKRVRYWDKAGTEGGTGAATAGVLASRGDDKLIYIEDVVSGHWSSFQREETIKQTAQLDAQKYGSPAAVRIYIEQEPGSGGLESAEATIKNLVGYVVEADRPTGDKDTRLEPFAAQAEAGNVRLVRADWNGPYIEEMCAIPNGKRRDKGDATAGGFNKLAALVTPAPPSKLVGTAKRGSANEKPEAGLGLFAAGKQKRKG